MFNFLFNIFSVNNNFYLITLFIRLLCIILSIAFFIMIFFAKEQFMARIKFIYSKSFSKKKN
ncbi:hypothetical protein A1OE_1335 [Candidatus Endolissoclinum faulkneri L2]|uniref:Uncharacterized protein n=1 Tax=Candidatus Endolissoclinum faulkneri L2 TaxID=1193729 RepID=K7Z5X9_9PROT|nr:hypothetical protein A1OE_1335 [Candidatus Endolissoclinum faulkneri L2]